MAKQGMNGSGKTHEAERNSATSISELPGEENPLIAGRDKIFHTQPPMAPVYPFYPIPTVPSIYPVIDTDLGRDNVENDLTAADRQDF